MDTSASEIEYRAALVTMTTHGEAGQTLLALPTDPSGKWWALGGGYRQSPSPRSSEGSESELHDGMHVICRVEALQTSQPRYSPLRWCLNNPGH